MHTCPLQLPVQQCLEQQQFCITRLDPFAALHNDNLCMVRRIRMQALLVGSDDAVDVDCRNPGHVEMNADPAGC